MKFIHLSDLHIGKKVNEFSMIKDQIYILDQILSIVKNEKVAAVIIAGDVYDKSIPPVEAVNIFDDFLTQLTLLKIPVLIIGGNHDSPERLGFGSSIMQNNGVYIYSVFDGTVHSVNVDGVDFHMLPFIKPAVVKRYYPNVESYEDAVNEVIKGSNIDMSGKNVIISHQFVTSQGRETLRSDSEGISVGGLDNIDASVFNGFDYAAIGHIHRPQYICDNVRYCGSPLKYSFSEAPYDKSVTVVDTEDFSVKTIPLIPLHNMRMIKGDIETILSKKVASAANCNDYLHITLTDPDRIIDAMDKVRNVYPNVMQLEFQRDKEETHGIYEAEGIAVKTPLQLFEEFYKIQNGTEMSDEQVELVSSFMEEEE
ncbi:MAG: exonuclease SbcCD subunit D [Hominilimicola sp.]